MRRRGVQTLLIVLIPLLALGGLIAMIALREGTGNDQKGSIRLNTPTKAGPSSQSELSPQKSGSDVDKQPTSGAGALKSDSQDRHVEELLGTLREALTRDHPDAAVVGIMAIGSLLRDPENREATRGVLVSHVEVESDSAMAGVLAMVLAVYDAPATDQVKVVMSSAKARLQSAYGLMTSLTIRKIPSDWSSSLERQMWEELLLSDQSVMPEYRKRFTREMGPKEIAKIEGVTYLSGGVKHFPNKALNQLGRTRISDSSVIGTLFEYVSRTGDARLASRMPLRISPDPDAFNQLLTAYHGSPFTEAKRALSRLVDQVRPPDDLILESWYREEPDTNVRRRLALALMGMQDDKVTAWFDELYPIEPSEDLRLDLARRLASSNTAAARERLMMLTKSGPVTERRQALRLLGTVHVQSAVAEKEKFVVGFLGDELPDMRWAAVYGLYKLTSGKHAETFRKIAAEDSSPKVRGIAEQVLKFLEMTKSSAGK